MPICVPAHVEAIEMHPMLVAGPTKFCCRRLMLNITMPSAPRHASASSDWWKEQIQDKMIVNKFFYRV
jgi:hypothetical protein